MEEIVRYKTEGAIDPKIMGYNQGERNTEYFHSLEKRHFNCKTIRNLKRLSVSKNRRNRGHSESKYRFRSKFLSLEA